MMLKKRIAFEITLRSLKEQAKSILCLNGKLPVKKFFQTNLPIIAADGAANSLIKKSIYPDIIIGDLDSIELSKMIESSTIIHTPDQNFTDFQKSLFYLQEHQLLPALVCGIDGGCLAHILHNIAVIIENKCMLYAPPVFGIVLDKGEYHFTLKQDSKISFFGIKAKISSKGLKWELDNYVLNFPTANSISNLVISNSLKITIEKGKVLLLVGRN